MSESDQLIRPELSLAQIHQRGQGYTPERIRATKKALQKLHMLETMAVKIYQYEITRAGTPLDTYLTAAMANEMTHLQDFQAALYEFNFRPRKLRGAFWLVGIALGLGSRLLGPSQILRTGIWAENKAVRDYERFFNEVDWDEEMREVVAKNAADEEAHVARWERLLRES